MTREFGWSYGLFSGVVSLGGLCAIGISPFVGRLIDRYGSGVILAVTSAIVGCCAFGLSLVGQAWAFYALYVPGRMAFASPLELGTTTAINNWFIRRRALALFLLTVSQSTGLAAMPLVANFLIGEWGWRNAWAWLGIYTLAVGILPALLLVARRPEDMGLTADPRRGEPRVAQESAPTSPEVPAESGNGDAGDAASRSAAPQPDTPSPATLPENNYTVSRALRTRAFYVMAIFSGAGFMVQAGVSLHQVSHFINQGLDPSLAALTAGAFAFCQMLGGFVWASLASRRAPIRILLAASAFCVSGGALGVQASATLAWGLPAASILGAGVGGLHLLLRLAWAEYYGREHLGSITGITLPVQVGGQALGPVIAGFLYDFTGSYLWPFRIFSTAVFIAGILVLIATPPRERS
jgi:MFS family permease